MSDETKPSCFEELMRRMKSAILMALVVGAMALQGTSNALASESNSLLCVRGLKAVTSNPGPIPRSYADAKVGFLRMHSKSAAESTALKEAEPGRLSDLYACIDAGVLNLSTVSVINSVLSGAIDPDDRTSGAFAKGTSEVVSQCQVAIAIMGIPFAQTLGDSRSVAVASVLGERAGGAANILLEIETGISPGEPGRAKSFLEDVDKRVQQLAVLYDAMSQDRRNAAYRDWTASCSLLGVDLSLASAVLSSALVNKTPD
jgi:hypothetical protein